MAKAAFQAVSDAEALKCGERNRIRYPGSPHLKLWILGIGSFDPLCAEANALSIPPGNYGRKAKTQRN